MASLSRTATDSGYHCFIYGFSVGAYDRATPLILDPAMLVNRGYIGGSEDDVGYDIAIDSQGCAYITGYTSSTEATFPASGGLEYLI